MYEFVRVCMCVCINTVNVSAFVCLSVRQPVLLSECVHSCDVVAHRSLSPTPAAAAATYELQLPSRSHALMPRLLSERSQASACLPALLPAGLPSIHPSIHPLHILLSLPVAVIVVVAIAVIVILKIVFICASRWSCCSCCLANGRSIECQSTYIHTNVWVCMYKRMRVCVCLCACSVISCGGVAAVCWAPSGTVVQRGREKEGATKIDRIFNLNVINLQILCGGQALKYDYFTYKTNRLPYYACICLCCESPRSLSLSHPLTLLL